MGKVQGDKIKTKMNVRPSSNLQLEGWNPKVEIKIIKI